jgi:hypothetical protein
MHSAAVTEIGTISFASEAPLEDAEIDLIHVPVGVKISCDESPVVDYKIAPSRRMKRIVRRCRPGRAELELFTISRIDSEITVQVCGGTKRPPASPIGRNFAISDSEQAPQMQRVI